MTNQEILKAARKQSAIDLACEEADFCSKENKVVISKPHPEARKYLKLPFFCNLVSYGNNIVASVSPQAAEVTQSYINRYSVSQCFETPNIFVLAKEFQKYGTCPYYMAEYFLPDMHCLKEYPCPYPVRLLEADQLSGLYTGEWGNALCEKRKHLDRLAAAAFDGDRMIGMAGCSADCDTMWQIGVDVLPEYRKKGIAAALTSRLAIEILKRGKVPFYCAAWSNLPSVRNAVHSGFRPAWIELTSIELDSK